MARTQASDRSFGTRTQLTDRSAPCAFLGCRSNSARSVRRFVSRKSALRDRDLSQTCSRARMPSASIDSGSART